MAEVKQRLKVKVKAKLTERDKDTKEVIGEYEIPEHIIDDEQLVKDFMAEKRGGSNGTD